MLDSYSHETMYSDSKHCVTRFYSSFSILGLRSAEVVGVMQSLRFCYRT